MSDTGLTPRELALITSVLDRAAAVREAILYGSRAKGTYRQESDVDLALVGVDDLQAEAVAEDLEELPLPYRFDVKALERIRHPPLREHIARVGISLYRRDAPQLP